VFTKIFLSAVFLLGLAVIGNSLAGASPDQLKNQLKKQDVIGFLNLEAPMPDDWVQQKPTNPMRLAQCRIPAAQDAAPGELVVYYFGRTHATLDANIARWRSQFFGPEGRPVEPAITTLSVGDIPVTLVEFHGGYARGIGLGPSENVNPGQIMIIAVVDAAAQGLVYVQMHGPSATISENRAAFKQLVRGIHKSASST